MQLIIWIFAASQVYVVNNYAKISDNMITGYDLLEDTNMLVMEYLEVLRNPSDETNINQIKALEVDILVEIDGLEKTITNPESRTTFQGFKNIIYNLLNDEQAGLEAISNNDLVAGYGYYDELVRNQTYAKESAAKLIFNELEATESLHQSVIRDRNLYLIVGFVSLLFTNIFSISYSLYFINKTTAPIIDISNLSRSVAKGNYNTKFSDKYQKQEDEIGTLTRSLVAMIKKLVENIESLDKSNKEILTAQEDLKKSNAELEQINQVMTGRELKMIELKKELEKFKNKTEKK